MLGCGSIQGCIQCLLRLFDLWVCLFLALICLFSEFAFTSLSLFQVPNVNRRKRQIADGIQQTVPGDMNQVTIDNLQSGIPYTVSISASTIAGEGPTSSEVYVPGERQRSPPL